MNAEKSAGATSKAATQPTETSPLHALIARLLAERDALDQAEAAVHGIGRLLSRAEAVAEQEGEAQEIRDRLRNARLDLQRTIRELPGAVAPQATRSDTGRALLARLDHLSPYPSIHTADEALSLVEALLDETVSSQPPPARPSSASDGPQSPDAARNSNAALSRLASLPLEGPSIQDRDRMSQLLEEAIDRAGDNFKSAAGAIGVSENTLRVCRKGQPTSHATWRKLHRYVKKALSIG